MAKALSKKPRPTEHFRRTSDKKHPIWRKAKHIARRIKVAWRKFTSQFTNPHRSFRRSYREDYLRSAPQQGLLSHAITTFQLIFRNWKIFLPFIILMTISYTVLVGLLSENLYQQFQTSIDESSVELANGRIGNFAKAGILLLSTVTTGGLDTGMGEVQTTFMILLFLIMWLVTIFLLRHILAGEHPKLRDGLYNALAPLLSTLAIFVVVFIQAIPIMLVIITYSAAVITDFLATPFYALVYFIFAALMILLSAYLLSSSLIALVAVTAPGMYPMAALISSSNLMRGRRVKLIVRAIYLLIVVAFVYVVTMLPIILLDLWLKGLWSWLDGVPIVPFCLLIVTCFIFIFATTYLYRYYRWLLDYHEK